MSSSPTSSDSEPEDFHVEIADIHAAAAAIMARDEANTSTATAAPSIDKNSAEHEKFMARTADDIADFWANTYGRIKYLDNPTTEEFLREAVAPHQPVIIRNAVNHWPAMRKWNLDFF